MNTSYSKTFVYVSSADDADIGTYEMLSTGKLLVGTRVKAAPLVMPMAIDSKRQLLFAGSRAAPYTVFVYRINSQNGALTLFDSAPLAESFPFISLDKTGRYLFSASYRSSLVSVNAIDADGKVEPHPIQTVPVGQNAHCVRIDATNQFVFVPCLGSDELTQFKFDQYKGRLDLNTPGAQSAAKGSGPRHFVFSPDNRFVYLLCELDATITTFSLDQRTGLLSALWVDSALPPHSDLQPGLPRGPAVATNTQPLIRSLDKDIWAADIRITPDGKFLIASERTNSTLTVFRVEPQSGKISQTSHHETERQPRGFNIDPSSQFVVVTGELSDTISVYRLEPETGTLLLIEKYPTGKASSWVEIVNI